MATTNGQSSSAASSASDETRAANNDYHHKIETMPLGEPIMKSDGPTEHVDLHFFDREGHQELSRQISRRQSISRQQSRASTWTQDPQSDDFDYEKHLKHVLKKSDNEGIPRRDIGVAYSGLNVKGTGSGLDYAVDLGRIISAPSRLGQIVKSMRHPAQKMILRDFEGSIKPGEMMLALGRPGSGCTTLLKVLSNNTEAYRSVEGTRSYSGLDPTDVKQHHSGDLAYLPEDDVHLPTLTVGETLAFAAATRAPSSNARLGTRQETINETRDVLLTLFGLRHTFNTKVGNDIVRGVSGGERKRVSICELMASGAKLACHDNSTRGLDASTALEYARALRIATDVGSLSTILSIYQCGENIFNLFDKICVIYEGRMVYMGPRQGAVKYFKDMGYEPQPRQTSADFVVAVTDPKGRFVREGYEGRVPKTADEFAEYWRRSEQGKLNSQEVANTLKEYEQSAESNMERFRHSAKVEKAKHVSPKSIYVISYPMQVRLAMRRRWQMFVGDAASTIIVTVAAIVQALIIGSVYFQMPDDTSGFFSRGGVLFFAILYNSFTGMAEIANAYSQRPVLVRQRQYAMIRPSADMLALNFIDQIPKGITLTAFSIILYFMSGLAYTADQWFVFLLFVYITTLAMLTFFRALASSSPSEPIATSAAGVLILIIAIYTGYAIPRPSMKVWFRWLSYAQPVSFGFEALIANEFRRLNVPCAQLVPSGPGYEGINIANQVCAVQGASPGSNIVVGSQYLQATYQYTYSNVWRNFGIIIGYTLFFLAINLVTAEYQKDASASGGVLLFKAGRAPKEIEDQVGAVTAGDVEQSQADNTNRVEDRQAIEQEKEKAANKLEESTDVFTWRDVCYDVPIKKETRRLLNNVSGYVAPGKMTCLMGESGAGKTTLLNVLAQRVTTGVVSGDMLVNGKPLPISFQRQTGYCQQQDTHLATATVREALQFSARLRQPASVSDAEKLEYVEEIISLLEMESYAEAVVGEVGMGLNVEMRKRLTIGVELVAKPALLIFLDEPSSGLDSQSSWSIMQLLRKLADHGQAILATIHQPSSELFQVFDRLLLLKKGGETVYFGELGKNSKTLVDYFGARSDLKCGPEDNPAEYILDVIGAGAGAKAKEDWHQLWRDSDEFQTVQREIDEFHSKMANQQSQADASPDSGRGYAAHTYSQFKSVTIRVFQNYWRDPTYIAAKLLLNVVGGLFIGFSFWDSPDTVAGAQNKLFAVFMAVVLASPLTQQLQPKFLDMRTLYMARERPSRMYNWFALVFSAVVVEIPYNIVCGTIFYLCWYFTVGFPSSTNRAGYAYLMFMLFELYFASFGQFVAAMSPNPMVASILFATFFSFVIIFNGVVQPYAQLPYFWRSWMYNLTPFTYLIEGLLANAMGQTPIRCTAEEFLTVLPPGGQDCLAFLEPYTTAAVGYAEVQANGACGYCQYATGDEFLSTVNMAFSHRWRDIGFMCAYICFNVAATFVLFYVFTIADFKKSGKAKPSKGKGTDAGEHNAGEHKDNKTHNEKVQPERA